MLRLFALIVALTGLTACTNPDDIDDAPAYLGNFHFGHNVVVAPNITKGPTSRDATKEEWIEAMKAAMDERFGRYEGTKLYHMGISVEGYVLALPGIPLVASPKSALIIRVTAWDDAANAKLNAEPEQVTIVESISGSTVLGSGLTQSKEVQMENLSRNAAKLIEKWLVRMNDQEGWFEDDGKPAKGKPRPEASVAVDAAEASEEVTEGSAAAEADAVVVDDPTLPDTTEAETDSAAAAAEAATVVLDEPEVAPPSGDE